MRRNMRLIVLAVLCLVTSVSRVDGQDTYVQRHQTATDATFILRVKMAAVQSAIAIANESPTTVNHTERVRLAYALLASPDQMAPQLAFGAASDGVTTVASTDAQLATRIASIWDAYALRLRI